jgi:hypothetical protein
MTPPRTGVMWVRPSQARSVVISLEGANCADLPGFVIDKYFDADGSRDRFAANVARAICQHCVVLEQCREQALGMPGLPKRGIIGGVAAHEIKRARKWRNYELGISERVPSVERPAWLARPEAAETIEQGRIEQDADEPPVER